MHSHFRPGHEQNRYGAHDPIEQVEVGGERTHARCARAHWRSDRPGRVKLLPLNRRASLVGCCDWSRREHDLADGLAGLQCGVRLGDLLKRQHTVDNRPQRSVGEAGPDFGDQSLHERRLFLGRARTQG